jgi:glycerol uptake facilitator-like aquaporin
MAAEYNLGMIFASEMFGMWMVIMIALGTVANHVLYPTTGHGLGYLGVACGFGFAFSFAIMAFGSVSAMLNPAAAMSMLVAGNIKVGTFFIAVLGELVGAFLGGLTLYLIYTPQLHKAGSTNFSYRLWIETSKASMQMQRDMKTERKAKHAAKLAAKKQEIAAKHAAKTLAKAAGASPDQVATATEPEHFQDAENALAARDKPDNVEVKEFGAMEDTDDDPFLGIWVTRPAVWAPLQSFMTEFIFTFIFLMLVNLTAARGQYLYQPSYGLYANIFQPVVIGFIIAASILAAGPTGFAGNPARDLGPRLAHWILPLPKSKRIGSEWKYAWIPVIAPLCAGACAGGLYQAWLPQLKGTVKADTNPFSTNALGATSIEQQVKGDTAGAAAGLVLGQDTKASKRQIGAAVKSALGQPAKRSGVVAG